MKVTSNNYVELAVRTDNKYDPQMMLRLDNPAFIKNLHHLMRVASSLGELADVNKRFMFYGVPVYAANSDSTLDKTLKPYADPELRFRMQNIPFVRLLHSVVGIITEMGELIDILYAYLFEGQAIDFKHVQEEYGDSYWYIALGLDTSGFTMENVLLANVLKLRARYPDGFKEFDAVNRDLERERIVLDVALEANTVNQIVSVDPELVEMPSFKLKDAIVQSEDVAANTDLSLDIRQQHQQIAAWLKELQALKSA